MKVSKLSFVIIFFGLLFAASLIYGRYDTWQQGLRMESFHSGISMLATLGMISCAVMLAGAGIAALFRAIWRKKFQPLIACAIAALLAIGADFIPMPSYLDGLAQVFSKQDERFYLDLADRLRKLPEEKDEHGGLENDVPAEFFSQLPGLADLFPSHQEKFDKTRFEVADTHIDVFRGGGMAGHRGFRIYREPDVSPYPAPGEYVGSFRQIHPRVFAYSRFY